MSKGIRQFNRALTYANTNRSFSKEYKADVKAVKKYLKEREELEDKASFYEAENKRLEKLVNIFKNAITIIHKPMEVKVFDPSNQAVSMLAQTLTELRANQLDIRLRDTLRQWVLENACPLECKALKEIIALHNDWLAYQKSDYEFFTLLNDIICKYDLKEVIEK